MTDPLPHSVAPRGQDGEVEMTAKIENAVDLLIPKGSADAVTWATEHQDIANAVFAIRGATLESADRVMRSLLAVAKTAAFGAGVKAGLNLGERLANEVLNKRREQQQ